MQGMISQGLIERTIVEYHKKRRQEKLDWIIKMLTSFEIAEVKDSEFWARELSELEQRL